MPFACACSHCQSRFNLADKLTGKNVKCPKCGEVFRAVAAKAAGIAAPRVPAAAKGEEIAKGPPPLRSASRSGLREKQDAEEARPRPGRGRPVDEDDEDDRPRRSKRKRKQKANTNLLVGLCVGGGVFVLGVIGIAIWMASGKSPPATVAVVARAAPQETAIPVQPAPQQQEPQAQPLTVPSPQVSVPANPVPVTPTVPPPVPATPPQAQPTATKGLQPGAKITVRPDIQGAPPVFNGDYNKHVAQNLEIALGKAGYEPVPEGGLILQVRAQVSNTVKNISVRTLGVPPPQLRPKTKPGQPAAPVPNQTQTYPIEQITATLLLTDAQGTALWKQEHKFTVFSVASVVRLI